MNKNFYDVNDVREQLNCCRSKAYRIIRELNDSFSRAGGIVQPGKVPIALFNEKILGVKNERSS